MTNLVFDLSNMMFRSLHIIGGFGKQSYTFDNQKELDELMRKISMDISYIIRLINPSRVIFAIDQKSWRKGIKIEENEGYKGNREKSDYINWDKVYGVLDEFINIVEQNGMIVSKLRSAEADDVIALWVNELLYNRKQHVITVSGDEDIRQLVKSYKVDNKMVFSTVFNPFMQGKNASRKLHVPEGDYMEWINQSDDIDICNMSGAINVDKEDFKRIQTTDKVRIEETNGNNIAMRKIFCGDDGDNIPALYTWVKTLPTGEKKEARITNSIFEKIIESIQITGNEYIDHTKLKDRSKKILESIIKLTKNTPPFNIEDRINRQIKLVVLDKNVFPTFIVDEFNATINENLNKSRPEISSINMNSMLQGTRYVKTGGIVKKGNESSIFKQIDKANAKNLF